MHLLDGKADKLFAKKQENKLLPFCNLASLERALFCHLVDKCCCEVIISPFENKWSLLQAGRHIEVAAV